MMGVTIHFKLLLRFSHGPWGCNYGWWWWAPYSRAASQTLPKGWGHVPLWVLHKEEAKGKGGGNFTRGCVKPKSQWWRWIWAWTCGKGKDDSAWPAHRFGFPDEDEGQPDHYWGWCPAGDHEEALSWGWGGAGYQALWEARVQGCHQKALAQIHGSDQFQLPCCWGHIHHHGGFYTCQIFAAQQQGIASQQAWPWMCWGLLLPPQDLFDAWGMPSQDDQCWKHTSELQEGPMALQCLQYVSALLQATWLELGLHCQALMAWSIVLAANC